MWRLFRAGRCITPRPSGWQSGLPWEFGEAHVLGLLVNEAGPRAVKVVRRGQ
mgnify:CR=1 FL=1